MSWEPGEVAPAPTGDLKNGFYYRVSIPARYVPTAAEVRQARRIPWRAGRRSALRRLQYAQRRCYCGCCERALRGRHLTVWARQYFGIERMRGEKDHWLRRRVEAKLSTYLATASTQYRDWSRP